MSDGFDFSAGRRGAIGPPPASKRRITIRLDDDVIEWFRAQVERAGGWSYQTLINATLRDHMKQEKEALEETLRRVVREELRSTA